MSQSNATNGTTLKDDFMFADDAMHEVLLEIARANKGICPELDKKIDAVASEIANHNQITHIEPHGKNSPKVPIYLEGEPGQGKSSLVEAAAKKFCSLVGLNYVEEPPENYVFQPNDFYYVKVNLSGAQNKSDFGGMLIRTDTGAQKHIKLRRKAAEIGSMILDEALSRSKALVSFAKDSGQKIDLKHLSFDQGPLECMEINLVGDDSATTKNMTLSILRQLNEEAKQKGVGISNVKNDTDVSDDRISYLLDDTKTKFTIFAPRPLDLEAEYASAVLPSIRFAKFKKVRFGLVNFDDVANASANIRNILLEVLQKGRYTGTMDIGNAYVVLSGNMGAEDGTNTMSMMSDAELTRMRKISVRDNHEDWAKRVMTKYSDEVGDCLMASFVQRHGSKEGIFRPGTNREKKGVRKSNGRALENCIEVIRQYFAAAQKSNISPLTFKDRIVRDIKDCAGTFVGNTYESHFVAMLSHAIPLAEDLVNRGDWSEESFENHSGLARNADGTDFCFRFAAALSDTIAMRVTKSLRNIDVDDPAKMKVVFDLITESVANASHGWAALNNIHQASAMTYSFSNLSMRLMNIPGLSVYTDKTNKTGQRLSSGTTDALSKGIAIASKKGVFGNEEETFSVESNFVSATAGANLIGVKKAIRNKS